MTLDQLMIGRKATIQAVACDDAALRKHMLEMGLTPGAEATMLRKAPLGDPLVVRVRGCEIALRRADAGKISLGAAVPQASAAYGPAQPMRRSGPVPSGRTLRFALVGNPNCGKTTLFNRLTGANQRVGNFPGVTVERKDGVLRRRPEITLTDLPGVYSLSPYSAEERVTRSHLTAMRPDCVINILDATHLERSLYLTSQLTALGLPMVVALNMMDEVRRSGTVLNLSLLEQWLGLPVVPISAARSQGLDELVDQAVRAARQGWVPPPLRPGNQAVQQTLERIEALVARQAETAGLSSSLAAAQLLEGEEDFACQLGLTDAERTDVERIIRRMEEATGRDRLTAMAEARFGWIGAVCGQTVKVHAGGRGDVTHHLDRVLTGRFTALPAFVLIMAAVAYVTFGPPGAGIAGWLEGAVSAVLELTQGCLVGWGVHPVVQSLVVDGVLAGVGSVLGFLPVILMLFLCLSLLEDSGYMARVALVLDRMMRAAGLSGTSAVALMLGFGCSVPAVLAVRTLPARRDRRMTVLLTPFMSCSAKLPIYGLLIAAFFPSGGAAVTAGLYLGGLAMGMLWALTLKRTILRGASAPFVLELPRYRLPMAGNVLRLMLRRTKEFLHKAFTVIFVASAAVWFLESFDAGFTLTADPSHSLLALVSGWLTPIFRPLGLGDWRIIAALITGLTAKETVVSTLGVLMAGAPLTSLFNGRSALIFLIFTLLYTPCAAAVAAARREIGGRWALGMAACQCLLAWLVSFGVMQWWEVMG